MANSSVHNDLFSSVISDIKSYTGKDPLLPWLRGIRKMKESIPPQFLREKLPRFLQKCAQTFETDRRYTNDLRYFRVWLQLLDFVDDPRIVLRTMEANRIGMKRSLFYQAYALYYEKMKKFEDAEKMYRLGVQNLAEPVDELQKSYEQFLHRLERHKNKRIQRLVGRTNSRPLCAGGIPINFDEFKENNESMCSVKSRSTGMLPMESLTETQPKYENTESKKVLVQCFDNEMAMKESNHTRVAVNLGDVEVSSHPSAKKGVMRNTATKFCGDDTVVIKFVDTAIVGKSEAEDARHHGLVEPTINTKEAMNSINSMFREPLVPAPGGRKPHRSQPKADHCLNNGFEVFIDENLDNGIRSSNQSLEKSFVVPQQNRSGTHQPLQEPLQIYVDDEEDNETNEIVNDKYNLEQSKIQKLTNGASISSGYANAFVFPGPNDILTAERPPQARHREDTVVYRFVGSTISDGPEVENVCHHGLVDPTINLKEAMDDINSMFGKPIEFARKNRPTKQDNAPGRKGDCGGFLILPDDNLDCHQEHPLPSSYAKNESDLFEPTVFTKEAMAEINKMFGMPLDF